MSYLRSAIAFGLVFTLPNTSFSQALPLPGGGGTSTAGLLTGDISNHTVGAVVGTTGWSISATADLLVTAPANLPNDVLVCYSIDLTELPDANQLAQVSDCFWIGPDEVATVPMEAAKTVGAEPHGSWASYATVDAIYSLIPAFGNNLDVSYVNGSN